jgi:hypothetical protein
MIKFTIFHQLELLGIGVLTILFEEIDSWKSTQLHASLKYATHKPAFNLSIQ